MISSRLFRTIPLVLFALALGVRLIGLNWGLPTSERFYSYHPDERQMLGAIATVVGGDLNPHFFNYPSLFIYLSALTHFLASGFIPSGNSVWELSRDVLLHARWVSALLGALTVPVVFALGREIGGARLGVLAALLLCFAPAHVQHSHFATVDVAATFWIAMSLWLATRALDLNRDSRADTTIENETTPQVLTKRATAKKAATRKAAGENATSQNEAAREAAPESYHPARDLLLSALCAGLGAATKYNAVLVLLAPLAALCFIEYSNRARLVFGIVATAIAGFLVGCPFSVLSFGEWWGTGENVGVAYELLKHPGQGHGDVFLETGNGWWYHATFNLPFATTAPVAMAAGCGVVLAIKSWLQSCGQQARPQARNTHRVLVPCAAFALIYFGALGFSQVRFLRYLLPLLPVLAVCAALCVRDIGATWRAFPLLARSIATCLVLIAAAGTLNVLWPLTQTDPRDAAKAWLDRQPDKPLPLSVGLADAQFPLWFYTPPLWPQDAPPGSPQTWQSVPRNSRYDLQPLGLDAAALRRTRPLFWVWSELQWRERERLKDPAFAALRRELANEYLMRAFHNTPPLQLPGRDFVPHDFLYPNPRVEVWSRQRL
ncbi:MAG TPA: glycosyltransferase family 39 protein [Abditibacteriaceae bacterium]|nr:glycosyltransferase family 39 protein [Abditibacteriaceae bacterium]